MNVRTMLILAVTCVAGLMIVCWRKEVVGTAAPLVSEPAEVGDSTSGNNPQKRLEPSPGHSPRKRKATGMSRTAFDETVARLVMEIQDALASHDPAARERALTNLFPALVFHNVVTAARLAETNSSPETR